jgi:protein O-mannosyl-transferase
MAEGGFRLPPSGPEEFSRSDRPFQRRDGILAALLLLATLLAYQSVRHAGFIWDDDRHLTANPCIVGPLGLKQIWTTQAARICPLTLTTFWVEHALWGLSPLPYHLVNVLLHGANAVLLWRLLRRLRVAGAWLGAALWALHPVQVETVAWITELKNTQSCLFYLLAVRFFLRWIDPDGSETEGRRQSNYPVALCFSALAMASKSSTVVLPAVLALCAWWTGDRRPWKTAASLVPVALMSVASSALSIWTQHIEGANSPLWARSWPERIAVAGRVFWFYLGKLGWPHPLVFIYPRWHLELGRSSAYLPTAAMGALFVLLGLGQRGRLRPACFAFGYFLIALLPVLGVVDHFFLRYSFVGDHFQYLASIGPLALAGAGIFAALGAWGRMGRLLKVPLSAGLLSVLGFLTWRQTANYADAETLWRSTLADNPECWMAIHNLGMAALKEGRVEEAVADFHRTLEINPDYAEAHNNLGTLLMRAGRLDAAFAEYDQALRTDPSNPEINRGAGVALLRSGHVNEAIGYFQVALKSAPNNPEIRNVLGAAFLQAGRPNEAAVQFQRTVELNPDYAGARSNLGTALLQMGNVDGAIGQYRRAIAIEPDNPDFHRSLGIALFRKGLVGESDDQFKEALRLKP